MIILLLLLLIIIIIAAGSESDVRTARAEGETRTHCFPKVTHRSYTHMYIYIYIYTHTHVYTHMYTHIWGSENRDPTNESPKTTCLRKSKSLLSHLKVTYFRIPVFGYPFWRR